jgi:hypothetical protein
MGPALTAALDGVSPVMVERRAHVKLARGDPVDFGGALRPWRARMDEHTRRHSTRRRLYRDEGDGWRFLSAVIA